MMPKNYGDWLAGNTAHCAQDDNEVELIGDVDGQKPIPPCTHLVLIPSQPFCWTAPETCRDIKCTIEMYGKLTDAEKFHWTSPGIMSNNKHVVHGKLKESRVNFMEFVHEDFALSSINDHPMPEATLFVGPSYFHKRELNEREQFLTFIGNQRLLQAIEYKRKASDEVEITKIFCKLQVDARYVFMFNLSASMDHFIIFERSHLDKFDATSYQLINDHMAVKNMSACLDILVYHKIPFAVQVFG
jgi:hypothetical protein